MLQSQNGRRRENCNLFSVHRRLVRRANRDFRFPESHIAANQSVHRTGTFHIGFDFRNGAQLIRRFLVRKFFFKLDLAVVVLREGETLRRFPLGVNFQKFFGNIFDGFFRTGFYSRPFAGI